MFARDDKLKLRFVKATKMNASQVCERGEMLQVFLRAPKRDRSIFKRKENHKNLSLFSIACN